MARASKGGTVGMNGEFYPGGTFLPNTELPKMQKRAKPAGSRKQEIAQGQWEVPPEGMSSLWKKLVGTYASYDRTTQQLTPFMPFIEYQERTFPQFDRADIIDLIRRWNCGERWY